MASKQSKPLDFRVGWGTRLSKCQAPVVQVTWLDAAIKMGSGVNLGGTWQDGYENGMLMEDVGFLLKHDAQWVTLASDRNASNNEGFRNTTDIPRMAVCRVKVLSKGSKENSGFTMGLEDVLG